MTTPLATTIPPPRREPPPPPPTAGRSRDAVAIETLITQLLTAQRRHRRKRLAAAERWREQDAAIKYKFRNDEPYKLRQAKKDDTALADIWSEYMFHRDEGNALSADIQAEAAALVVLRGTRP